MSSTARALSHVSQFMRNNRGIADGKDASQELLTEIRDLLKAQSSS